MAAKTTRSATILDVQLYAANFSRDSNNCWRWHSSRNEKGYGYMSVKGTRRAHRWFYELIKGEIPEGLELDHLCRVRNCVNPAHLEAVTPMENKHRTRKDKCKRGHYMDVRSVNNKDSRACLVCKRAGTIAARKGISIEDELQVMKENDSWLLEENRANYPLLTTKESK